MNKASITDAKNNFSALIDRVKSGSPVLIVDRGRPVARLEPVTGAQADADGRLARLMRGGVVRAGSGSLPESTVATAPPRAKAGASAVRALIEERQNGR